MKDQQTASLWIVVILAVLGIAGVGAVALMPLRSALMDDRISKTQDLAETARSLIYHFVDLAQSGELTEEDAQDASLEAVSRLGYGDGDYFWVQDNRSVMVMHPFATHLNGQSLADMTDPNGIRLFAEIIDVVESQGDGVVEYSWTRPDTVGPVPKIAYAAGIEPWGWIVGTSIYVHDVDIVYQRALRVTAMAGAAAAAVLLFAAFLFGRLGRVSDPQGGQSAVQYQRR